VDARPASGCRECPAGRDALTGWGRLDVTAAIARAQAGGVPPADRLEPNDDAGPDARRLWGERGGTVAATLDFWEDRDDVYAVRLAAGQALTASLRGPAGARLVLWRPGTERVAAVPLPAGPARVASSTAGGGIHRVAYRVPAGAGGWYLVHTRMAAAGAGAYTLAYEKR
jgi:hypothetical protein